MALPLPLHTGATSSFCARLISRANLLPLPQTFHFRPLAIVGGERRASALVLSVVLASSTGLCGSSCSCARGRRDRVLGAMLAVATVMIWPILKVSCTQVPWMETTADRYWKCRSCRFSVATGRPRRGGARSLGSTGRFVTKCRRPSRCRLRHMWYGLSTTSRTKRLAARTEVNLENPQALAGPRPVMAGSDVEKGSAACSGTRSSRCVASQA